MVGGVFKRNSWKINLIRNKYCGGFSPFQEEITLRKVLLTCNIVTRTFDIQNICHSFGQCSLSIALANISKPSDLMLILGNLVVFYEFRVIKNNIGRKLVNYCK